MDTYIFFYSFAVIGWIAVKLLEVSKIFSGEDGSI